MSTPATTAFGLDAYEDIEALPLSELAPRIVRVRVDISDEPTPTQRLHEALTKEFILMQKRFNGARKTIIAFKLGEFAMVLQLLTSDSKVDVALEVKKQIGTPAVGRGETIEVVGKMYAITHNALNMPKISCMVGERYCDNKVLVLESVLDKAKENGGCIDQSMLNCSMRQCAAVERPTMSLSNYTMTMVDVAQQLSELNEANALADSIMLMQIKAEIERLLTEMPVETEMPDTEMAEVHVKTEMPDMPDAHPDNGMTLEQQRSDVEKRLLERADAAGKSPHELAFLELREQMSRMRAAHAAHTKQKAD